MATINPYLLFDGNCETAFRFYETVFGKKVPHWGRFGDIPADENMPPLSDEMKNKCMHVTLEISPGYVLMGSDTNPALGKFVVGNNIDLAIGVNSREEAERIFKNLSENGKITMELEETFWGAYFGMVEDQFGIEWMINYDDPAKVQPH